MRAYVSTRDIDRESLFLFYPYSCSPFSFFIMETFSHSKIQLFSYVSLKYFSIM